MSWGRHFLHLNRSDLLPCDFCFTTTSMCVYEAEKVFVVEGVNNVRPHYLIVHLVNFIRAGGQLVGGNYG